MTNQGIELEYERRHLERILGIVRDQLLDAERESGRRSEALADARREMREQASQRFGNLWSTQSFHELVDLNQYAQPLSVEQTAGEMARERIDALRRMLDAPYFARVDIRFDDGGDTERVYIGRATLKDARTHEILVYDWRAPISSVFYRFGTGSIFYDAPGGRITGEALLKRQFEIKHGALEYFFDADVQVQDEFLRQMLARNASPRMKAIVETIQRDQDAAIRDTEHELLMVQGVAGSGKTSIALHRAAYLMYGGLSSPLGANDILILSPGALFERYIHEVLPELGERNVRTLTLERLLSEALGGARVQSQGERFERLCLSKDQERAALMRADMAFKASGAFIEILERFARELPRRWIEFEDVCYAGRIVATRQQLMARAMAGDGVTPLGVRLRRMEASLWAGIHERRPARMARLEDYARRLPRHMLEIEECARAYSILECAALKRQIRRFTRLDCRALYARLMSDERAFRRLSGGIELPENIGDILRHTYSATTGDALPLGDAAAIAYLRLLTHGAGGHGQIRQVVVDEAQDYDPLHFAILNRLFPRARFTVLGDINQSLGRRADMALYGQIRGILNRRSDALVKLNKSFRCTGEILNYSLQFLDARGDIQGFNRSGDAPVEHAAGSAEEMRRLIESEVALCRESGYKSIALITRTARDAGLWHGRLKRRFEIGLVDGEAAHEPAGVFVIPVYLAKGLEFDAVLVLDMDPRQAIESEDRRMLYVACTRALHRLNLFFLDGERS